MDWSLGYIISQVFTIIYYLLVATSYYAKDRKGVLVITFLSLIANGIAYILLNAWTGLAMCIVAIIRNIVFLIDEKKNGKRETINKTDVEILIILYVISIVSAIFTYDGFLSLLPVFGTMLYTFSVWQKKTTIYKLMGIPISILWVIYNIYIMSIFGIILEALLLICSTIGYVLEVKDYYKTAPKTKIPKLS